MDGCRKRLWCAVGISLLVLVLNAVAVVSGVGRGIYASLSIAATTRGNCP